MTDIWPPLITRPSPTKAEIGMNEHTYLSQLITSVYTYSLELEIQENVKNKMGKSPLIGLQMEELMAFYHWPF